MDGNEKKKDNELPLVYSCSGCSDIAQLANHIAVDFDRKKIAEMSCISGVGGGVKPLVKKAQSGRMIIAIDGCPLQCSKHCLANAGVSPDLHYILTDFGLKKTYHKDYCEEDAEFITGAIKADLLWEEELVETSPASFKLTY